MKTHYIISTESDINLINDAAYIRPNLLFFDHLKNSSYCAFHIMIYRAIDDIEYEYLLPLTPFYFNHEAVTEEYMEQLFSYFKKYKQILKIPHKNQLQMRVILTFRNTMSQHRKGMKENITYLLNLYNLMELVNFAEEETWELDFLDFMDDSNHEDYYIPKIVDSILDIEEILSFDNCVDELFSHTLLTSNQNKTTDFIKIPLWKLPPLHQMTNAQLTYTSKEFKSILADFQKQLVLLSADLLKTTFSEKNGSLIKEKCADQLLHFVQPIQTSINDSLYISQYKNKFSTTEGITLCLGITSAANLVNYFEKTSVVKPYVASEIKQQLSRHIDLSSTHIFAYYEIYPSPETITN